MIRQTVFACFHFVCKYFRMLNKLIYATIYFFCFVAIPFFRFILTNTCFSAWRVAWFFFEWRAVTNPSCRSCEQRPNSFSSSSPFQRGLCCFPGFSNPGTAQRKGKIPKPLLAGVTSSTGGLFESGGFLQNLVPPTRHESGEMLLLEKQGLSSQQQRMQDIPNDNQGPNNNGNGNDVNNSVRHRSGSLPPSSLPRPPRSHRSGLPKRLGEYNRLDNSEIQLRKKSDGGDSLSSNGSTKRQSPARSLIPPPRKLGEYGRLSESDSRSSLRKTSSRGTTTPVSSERNSASTLSDNSASSLPPPSKLRLFSQQTRRGSSLGREGKSSTDGSSNKYRIQF